jgi:acetyltransferase-like isoleucine patch superfamily enzyme
MSSFGLIGGANASSRLIIGADCFINCNCMFDAAAPIEIGERVSLGEGVLITTSGEQSYSPESTSARARSSLLARS